MGLLQKVLERKLQREKPKYMRLEMQRAQLAEKINVGKRNREAAESWRLALDEK